MLLEFNNLLYGKSHGMAYNLNKLKFTINAVIAKSIKFKMLR